MTWQGQYLSAGVNKGRAALPSHLPVLSPTPQEIDEYITQARDKSYETMMRVGKRGLNLAANAAVTAAAKVRLQGTHLTTPCPQDCGGYGFVHLCHSPAESLPLCGLYLAHFLI